MKRMQKTSPKTEHKTRLSLTKSLASLKIFRRKTPFFLNFSATVNPNWTLSE